MSSRDANTRFSYCLLSEGFTAQAISHRLRISPRTVRKHLQHIYAKSGAQDRLTAVNRAREAELI
jgi:DNA-binding NarL/FixJ family response regulator